MLWSPEKYISPTLGGRDIASITVSEMLAAFVVDEPQQAERFHETAEFLQRAGELGRAVVGLKYLGQPGGVDDPQLQRLTRRKRSSQCSVISLMLIVFKARSSSTP